MVTPATRPASMGKRIADVIASGAVLLATGPIHAIASASVLLDDGLPVFFRQERAGRDGRTFRVLKYRTMKVNEAPPSELGQVRTGHRLVTKVGGVLRRTKVDELPQLLNVLKGEMSLVGPRPALPTDIERYDDYQQRRLSVRPGLTGWAQVNGNIELSWDERILLDVWYVDHWSWWLDVTILARTAFVVARGERIDEARVEEAKAHAMRVGWRGGEHGSDDAEALRLG